MTCVAAHLPHLVFIQRITATLRPHRHFISAVLELSTSPKSDVSNIRIVALLLSPVVLTSILTPHNILLTRMHTAVIRGFCTGE